MDDVLEAVNDPTSPFVVSDNKSIVKNVGDLTKKTLYAITFASTQNRAVIVDSFSERLNKVSLAIQTLSLAKANALASISIAYLDAMFKVNDSSDCGCLDKLFDFIDDDITRDETSDDKATIISLFSPGILEVASLTADQKLLLSLQESLEQQASFILEKVSEHPDDLEALGDLVNKYYKSTAAATRIVSEKKILTEIVKIIDKLYSEARYQYDSIYNDDPSTSIFFRKTCFELRKLMVDQFANVDFANNIAYIREIPTVNNLANNKFVHCCENLELTFGETAEIVEKVTIFKNICEGEIKAHNRLYDPTALLDHTTETLYNKIIDSAFNVNVISFAYSVMDAAANMPNNGKSTQIASGAGYEALLNATLLFGDGLMEMIHTNYSQESLQCFNKLCAAVLESTKDFDYKKLLTNSFESYFMQTFNRIVEGEPITTKIKNDCTVLYHMITKFCATAGKYPEFQITGFSNSVVKAYQSALKEIAINYPTYYDDVSTLFAQALDQGLSKAVSNYEFLYALGDVSGYFEEVGEAFALPSMFIKFGGSYEIYSNIIKLDLLFNQTSEFFMPIFTSLGEEDYSYAKERFDFYKERMFPLKGFDSIDKFDEVYNIWKSEFFDKIVRTINFEKFVNLANKASELVDVLLKEKN
ncbi:MAG: hypothetical protein MJ213_03800 [Bacilli bacterium]|nr:hypothetical protein [Bacilli bacterium]